MANYFSNLYPALLEHQRKRYAKTLENDNRKPIELKIGDQVLFYKPTLYNNKHVSAWEGPCKIYRKMSTYTYEIRDRHGRSFVRNIRNLRLCRPKITETEPHEPLENEPVEENHNFEIQQDVDINFIFSMFGE